MAGIRKILTGTYLTPDLAGAVASVAATWSHLELELEHTIRELTRMPHKVTRVLVTGMNARTRLGCVEGLAQLRDIDDVLLDEFNKIQGKRSGGPVYRMTPSSVMFDLSAVWFGRNECSLNTSPAPRALS